MTRPAARLLAATLAVVAGASLAACGSNDSVTPRPTAATSIRPTAGGPTNVPGGKSPAPTPAATLPGTTKTTWGTVWDDLPPGFPRYPGAEPADTGEGPASATLAVPAKVDAASDWYRKALQQAGYDTEALNGPMEDGSIVIDSVGSDPDCRIQTSLVPHGNQAIATILVAAACPFR